MEKDEIRRIKSTMIRKKEWLARILLGSLLVAATAAIWVSWRGPEDSALIRARMPESGGWSPGDLTAEAGIPLHIRLTSDDVTHGFAVGQMDFPAVDIQPGRVTEVSLTFDKPGVYTYYCTRWCGPNHWRMRGTIEVTGGDSPQPAAETEGNPPLYQELGIDIDADHPAQAVPQAIPVASAGESLLVQVPNRYLTPDYYRAHSPAQAWSELKAEPLGIVLDEEQIWSIVAAIWLKNTDPLKLKEGRELYAENCAACHGEKGAGDGVMAAGSTQDSSTIQATQGMGDARPANFTDARVMLGASPALLQGKIIRGGMGTGMPYWGPIFTEDQTWALVAYLWTFQFDFDQMSDYDLEVEP
jgi:mono/diheme cytochrome c family protein/plastocyanin